MRDLEKVCTFISFAKVCCHVLTDMIVDRFHNPLANVKFIDAVHHFGFGGEKFRWEINEVAVQTGSEEVAEESKADGCDDKPDLHSFRHSLNVSRGFENFVSIRSTGESTRPEGIRKAGDFQHTGDNTSP